MISKRRAFSLMVVLVLVLLMASGVAGVFASGEPEAGTVVGEQTFTLYGPTAVTTGTVNSTGSLMRSFNAVDVFVTVDVTNATVTSTVQYSADGTNWADADYEYATDSAIATKAYTRVQSADGTEVIRLPMAGEYLRVNMVVTGAATPTVLAVARNN